MPSTAILIMAATGKCRRGNTPSSRLNLFLTFHHLLALVVAALGAGLVRHFRLQALWADARSDRLKEIVRPALSAPRL